MSTYESDPAGLGVSQGYGPQELGGVVGVTSSTDATYQIVAEISAEELAANPVISVEIPEGYAAITSVLVEVEEAFGTGDVVDVDLDGSTILSAPVSVAATGLIAGTLASDPTVMDAGEAVTLDVSAIDSGSATGFAKVIVEVKRV